MKKYFPGSIAKLELVRIQLWGTMWLEGKTILIS